MAPSVAGAATAEVRSGPLSARVHSDPFALEFVDRADGDALRTRAALPPPDDVRARYGSLGYSFDLRVPVVNNAFLGYYVAAEVETLWFHARRVLSVERSGDGLRLLLETNDPLGHRLELILQPRRQGSIGMESRIEPGSGPLAGRESISGISFDSAHGERFFGFGERSNAADQTGNRVFNWAEEGPFSSGRGEDLLRPLVPEFTFPTGPTATNFPIPWAVSSRGLGVLIDQTERSYFRLGSDIRDAWRAEVEANRLRLTVFAGPEPLDVVGRYSAYAGRQPPPAPWFFGPWVQMPEEVAEDFRRRDVPVTVSQTYTHYLPCGAHVGSRDQQRERVRFHHRLGYRVTTYFNPHVCTSYQPIYETAAANGWFVRDSAGEPYVMTNPFTADQQISEFDFTIPGARGLFTSLLDEAIADGYDGWMEDFGEYTPTDSIFSDGRGGQTMHNLYPVLYHCTSYEHTRAAMGRDAAVFIRSGWHGVQPCARIVWGGDPTEDWSCSDGLCAAVHQALSMGMSGVAYWGTDIGGFHAIVNPRANDELTARWLEFGLVNGVMRTQRNGFGLGDNRDQRSQVWDRDVLPIWHRYAALRTQLFPYIWAASRAYQRSGIPITRHLALAFPAEAAALRAEEELMFGPELLVAPVIEEGADERNLYVPRGRWVDFWRAVSFEPASGRFRITSPTEPIDGGRNLTLQAPLDELPILVRAGALLPMLPPDVDTLTELGRRTPGVVSLGERSERSLLAFPRGRSSARFDAGRLVSAEARAPRAREWRLTVSSASARRWSVQASLSTLRRPFVPCELTLNGKALPDGAWRYNDATGTLAVRFRAGDAVLRASRPSQCASHERGADFNGS
jgi:alpha-glucosidase (family GH31 glycosyl hydrolase)